MNAKVDVLSVLDRLIGNARTTAGLTGDPRMRDNLRDGEQARAAVAEVIKSGSALCDLMPGLAGGPEFDRFVTALANAGDTK